MARIIERDDGRERARFLPLSVEPGHSTEVFVEPRVNRKTGALFDAGYNQVFINPSTGEILGKRYWGAFRVDAAHFMPFMYQMHMTLRLPETWGLWLVGGIAFVWMLDGFVGFYLALQRGRPFFAQVETGIEG